MKEQIQNYWTKVEDKAICRYYYCQSATTSASTRNYIYSNQLYIALTTLIIYAIQSCKAKETEDLIQDCHIHLFNHVLPRLKEDKLQAAFYFLYISTRRHIITGYQLKKNIPTETLDYYQEDEDYDSPILTAVAPIEDNEYRQAIEQQIVEALDKKIRQQRILNSPNTIFLILLRQYLFENKFDERGFGKYVMQRMNIKVSTLKAISSRCRVKTKLLMINLPEDEK